MDTNFFASAPADYSLRPVPGFPGEFYAVFRDGSFTRWVPSLSADA